MDKREFLETLRQSLNGEIMPEVIEQNIRYYEQYINSPTQEEEDRVLNGLGDPRLIAKTIIESERAAKEKGKHTDNQGSDPNYYEEEFSREQNNTDQGRNKYLIKLNWYQKLTIGLVILAFLIILIFLGRIIIGFLFAFGLPLILILLLLGLFRRR